MADQLSLRGGTTAEHATFTGANKEVTVDTTKKTLVVNDGATVGGHPLMRENASNSALALGSAATPSLKFTGDPNTGIYSPGADQLAVATNGVQRLFVSSAGLVSIGNSSPGSRLEIGGDASYDAKVTFNRVPVQAANDGVIGELFFQNNADSVGLIAVKRESAIDDAYIQFATQQTSGGLSEKMRITSAGLVGIGTSAPSEPLDVVSAASTARAIRVRGRSADNIGLIDFYSNDNTTRYATIGAGAANTFVIETANNERLRVDSSGRVGIGVTSPGAALDILGPTSGDQLRISNNASVHYRIGRGTVGGYLEFYGTQSSNNGYIFGGADGERARIDTSGRLLVGTTTQKGLLTLGSGSHYSVVDPGATIKKVDYTSAMGSEAFFAWRTWRSGKSYATGVSGVVTIAVPAPGLLRVKIMATADGVGVRNYAYEAYVFAAGSRTIDVIKETTLLTGGSSPAISGTNLVFTCPAAAVNLSLIYVEVEQVSSQNDTTITFS